MKVLYVSKALVTGTYRGKLRHLSSYVQVDTVVPERWGDQEPEPSPPGVPEPRTARAWFHGHNHLHVYARPGRLLEGGAPDLVHVDEEPYSLVTFQLGRLCRRRRLPFLFFTWQNLDKRLPPPFGLVRSAVFRAAAGGIAGTETAARVLERAGFDGPTAVVPQFGVDPDRFVPDAGARDRTRRRLDIPAAAFVVGYGGRLVAPKGVDVLVEAVARLDPAGYAASPFLVVVGDGPERESLEDLAERRGLGGRVRFAGHRASLEMPELLAAPDVLVLPSVGSATWTEQFGRILVEAMACGVPVVGSRLGEIPAVVGDAGDVVPPGDARALADALERLRASPDLRRRRAREGRSRVLERFTHERIARETVAFYERVMAGEAGGTAEGTVRAGGSA